MKNSELDIPNNVQELQKLVALQSVKLEEKDRQLKSKDNKIIQLEEHLRLLTHKRVCPSTEKYNVEQKDLFFDEAEQSVEEETIENEITVPSHNRKKPGRVAISNAFGLCGSGQIPRCLAFVSTRKHSKTPWCEFTHSHLGQLDDKSWRDTDANHQLNERPDVVRSLNPYG